MTAVAAGQPDDALLEELTGAGQGWLRRCRTAVGEGPEHTRALLVPSRETAVLARASLARWKGIGDDADLLEEECEEPDLDGLRVTADLSAARAIAVLACALTGVNEVDEACATFLDHAERAGLRSVGTQLLPAGVPVTSEAAPLGALVLHLLGQGGRAARGFGILTALELAGRRPNTLRTTEISVLFVNGHGAGEVGVLRLEQVLGGPSGLHPDPARMGFLQADADFSDSLGAAWAISNLASTSACVLWSVTVDRGAPANDITGESLGAAVAVGLDDLAPRHRWVRWFRPRRLDPTCAVTAGLDGTTLTRVGGYAGKLRAAKHHSLRVVVAAAAGDEATKTAPHNFADRITLASTIDEAIERTRTRVNYTLWSSVLAAALAVLLVVVGVTNIVQQRIENSVVRAELNSRLYANVARQTFPTDPALGQQLALAAYRTSPTPDARAALMESTAANAPLRVRPRYGDGRELVYVDDVPRVATTHDGDLIATGGPDGSVELAQITDTGVFRLPGFATGAGAIRGLALSADQQWLVVGGKERSAIWNLADRERPRLTAELDISGLHPWSAAFSPDMRFLAISADTAISPTSAKLLTWDLSAGADRPVPLPALTVPWSSHVDIAVNNSTLVAAVSTASSTNQWTTTIRAWSTATFAHNRRPISEQLLDGPGSGPEARSAEFSSDGRILTVGINPGQVLRWQFDDPAAPVRLPAMDQVENQFFDVSADPAARTAVVVGGDSTARLYDLDSGETVASFPALYIVHARLLRGGRSVVTSSLDHAVHVFDVASAPIRSGTLTIYRFPHDMADQPTATLPASLFPALRALAKVPIDPGQPLRHGDPPGTLDMVAISPTGTRAATVNEFGAQVWDITDPARPVRLGAKGDVPSRANLQGIVFTPDGRLALVDQATSALEMWDVSGSGAPRLVSRTDARVTKPSSLAFSPDGRLVAIGSYASRAVKVFDLGSGDPRTPIAEVTDVEADGYMLGLALSPQRQLAIATVGGLHLYDFSAPGQLREIELPGAENLSGWVEFDHDGRRIVSTGEAGNIRVWNLDDPYRPTLYANLQRGFTHWKWTTESFSAGGSVLTESAADGTLRQWRTDAEAIAREICASDTAPITSDEWERVLPGRPYVETCPAR